MKDIFCAKCQTVTPHKGSVDGNGEFVFECQTKDCDRFIKFAAGIKKSTLQDLLTSHQEANQGQVSVEAQEKTLADLLSEE
jgi:hypothetical protein